MIESDLTPQAVDDIIAQSNTDFRSVLERITSLAGHGQRTSLTNAT
jgi:hypothetical protein